MLFVGVLSLCFIAIDAVAESFIYSSVYPKKHIKGTKIVEEGKQKQQIFWISVSRKRRGVTGKRGKGRSSHPGWGKAGKGSVSHA